MKETRLHKHSHGLQIQRIHTHLQDEQDTTRQQNDIQRKHSRDTAYESQDKQDMQSIHIKESPHHIVRVPFFSLPLLQLIAVPCRKFLPFPLPSLLLLPSCHRHLSFSPSDDSNHLISPFSVRKIPITTDIRVRTMRGRNSEAYLATTNCYYRSTVGLH